MAVPPSSYRDEIGHSSSGCVGPASGSVPGRFGTAGDRRADVRYFAWMAIFFSFFCASGVFGRVTVSTPF